MLFRHLTGMPPGYLLHDKFWEDAFGTRHAAKMMSLGRLRRTKACAGKSGSSEMQLLLLL